MVGITAVSGEQHDLESIHHDIPEQFALQHMRMRKEIIQGWTEHFKNHPKNNYLTYRITDSGDFLKTKTYNDLFKPNGIRHGMQSFFFDKSGSIMGCYPIMKRSGPPFSDEEQTLYESISPYVFYAFRKYRHLLDMGFFRLTLDEIPFSIIITDLKSKVIWLNWLAKGMLKKAHGKTSSNLPEGLNTAFNNTKHLSNGNEYSPEIFRCIHEPSPYGKTLCFAFDKYSSRHLPFEGKGVLFVIDLKNNETTLTNREMEVLSLLAKGMTDGKIASTLSITERTVNTYVRNILNKLGSSNRTEAAVKAVRLGIIA